MSITWRSTQVTTNAVKFDDLKPGLKTNKKVMIKRVGKTGGYSMTYYNILYVNKSDRELILQQSTNPTVMTADEFDQVNFIPTDK